MKYLLRLDNDERTFDYFVICMLVGHGRRQCFVFLHI